MDYFYRLLTQMEIFTVLIVIGIFAVKTKVINEKGMVDLSGLIIRLTLPAMIFSKSVNSVSRDDITESFAEVVTASFLMFGVLYFVGYLLVRAFDLKGNYGRVFLASTTFGNVGFLGIPLILGILPERGMLYMSLFYIADQIVLWSLGFYLTLPEEKLKNASIKSHLSNIMSPAMIAIIIAMAFITLDWQLPATVNKAIGSVGNATTPLSLIYIGASFCFTNVWKFVSRKEYYAMIVGKMVLAPLFVHVVLTAFSVNPEIVTVITTLTAVPSMAAIAMFARANGSDEDCAIGAVMMTTVFCLLTLPLVAYITANFL